MCVYCGQSPVHRTVLTPQPAKCVPVCQLPVPHGRGNEQACKKRFKTARRATHAAQGWERQASTTAALIMCHRVLEVRQKGVANSPRQIRWLELCCWGLQALATLQRSVAVLRKQLAYHAATQASCGSTSKAGQPRLDARSAGSRGGGARGAVVGRSSARASGFDCRVHLVDLCCTGSRREGSGRGQSAECRLGTVPQGVPGWRCTAPPRDNRVALPCSQP